MQPRVDLAGDAAGEAGDGLELFERGVQECFGGAEVLEDPLLARRTDAGELVQLLRDGIDAVTEIEPSVIAFDEQFAAQAVA